MTPPPPHWRDALPWTGPARRGDKVLLGAIFAALAFSLALMPLKPFLLARHPVWLELITGSEVAVGAGAALARIGRLPLGLVVAAGVIGVAKFDWIFWLTGRRWGQRIVTMFAPHDRARRWVAGAHAWNPWWVRLAVVAAYLPGVPAAMVYALAGWSGMSLATFVVCDLAGAAIVVGLLAGLGYGLGQAAVDVVLLVDDYAGWVSVGLIVAAAVWSVLRARRRTPTNAP